MNKRGERSSQSYYKSNVSPYGSCYHSFCMRSSGVWNWGCVLPNWWRYSVWYVVVQYEWMICTASCCINHTLIRDYAGRTKLNQISGSLFLFFFCNKSCMFTKERITWQIRKEIHFILKQTNIPGDIKGLKQLIVQQSKIRCRDWKLETGWPMAWR